MSKLILLVLFSLMCFLPSGFAQDFYKKVQEPVKKSITIRQRIQKQREKWHKEYLELKKRYDELASEVEDLEDKNKDLKLQIVQKQNSINKCEDELKKLKEISKKMLPFLWDVSKNLKAFIEADVPFLKEEREKRIFTLKKVLEDPEISIGEKFRKVMEALFIEAEYGNTIEVYQDKVKINNKDIEGNVFRLGRIAMFFQSPDEKITAVYDPAGGVWKTLPKKYNRVISTAIDIAQRRRPASILILPIGKLETKP